MASDYITADEFRQYVRDTTNNDTAMIADCITAASREVDAICGRFFYKVTETRYFRPESLWTCDLADADIADTTGIALATETGNDGTYGTAWTYNTDYLLESVNPSSAGVEGWPYTWVRAIGTKVFPPEVGPFWRPTVSITADFGWAAVPLPVKQATRIAAAELYKLAEAPFGVAGFGAYGSIRIRENPVVDRLLSPYKKLPGGAFG